MRPVHGQARNGAGNRNRTYDLIITNDALYQLSYSGAEGLRSIDAALSFDKVLPARSACPMDDFRLIGAWTSCYQQPATPNEPDAVLAPRLSRVSVKHLVSFSWESTGVAVIV